MLRHASLLLAAYVSAAGLALLAALTPACIICADDDAIVRTCDEITDAVVDVQASCGLETGYRLEICGDVCSSHATCPDGSRVDECTAAIRSLGCDAIATGGYRELGACADLFEDMADSCSSNSGGDFDDDD